MHTDPSGHAVISAIIWVLVALVGVVVATDAFIQALSSVMRNPTAGNIFMLVVASIFLVLSIVDLVSSIVNLVNVIKASVNAFQTTKIAVQNADDGIAGSAQGNYNWPPNDGFKGDPEIITLQKGEVIDRYGATTGKFASPKDTPFCARSLPQEYLETKTLNTYVVLKPVQVKAGIVAPAFGQLGGGIQYKFFKTIEQLINKGVLGIL